MTTPEQKQYIIDNYKGYNLQEMSEYVGLTRTSTARLARQLGVKMTSRKMENPASHKDEFGVYHKNEWVRKTPEEISMAKSIHFKKWFRNNPHPRGNLGKRHTDDFRKRFGECVRLAWKDPNSGYNKKDFRQMKSDRQSKAMALRIRQSPSSIYSRTKKGWADVGDKRYYFKSSWEVKYANHLHVLLKGKAITNWEYEPDTFWFEKIKRGVRSYTPDFKLTFPDGSSEYHEVKGWMDAKSKTKLKRMRIYYPKTKLIVIEQSDMKMLGLI